MASKGRHAHVLAPCQVVLVRPRYPENLGAAARAMRVTGFDQLVLVAPHELADPAHPQARKLAVGSTDLLDQALVVDSLDDVLRNIDVSVATSARPGVSNIASPRQLSTRLIEEASAGQRMALIFGGERAGLRRAEVDACDIVCRIPMVANEPSMNLAQAVMVVLYELLVAAFDRGSDGIGKGMGMGKGPEP